MNTTIIAACAVCLAAAMLLDNRLDIPLGLTCPLVSFLICYFAYDMTAGKVITAFFPEYDCLSVDPGYGVFFPLSQPTAVQR